MKRLRYILIGLAVVLLAIQFIPNELPMVTKENPDDIMKSGLVDLEVAQLLKTSCYSCHSNETEYPWYSHIAPASWLVKRDVVVGREELNFSTWSTNDMPKMLNKLEDISAEVNEGDMPMPIYTLIHPSAKLSIEQRQRIVAWTEVAMDSLVNADDEENQ